MQPQPTHATPRQPDALVGHLNASIESGDNGYLEYKRRIAMLCEWYHT